MLQRSAVVPPPLRRAAQPPSLATLVSRPASIPSTGGPVAGSPQLPAQPTRRGAREPGCAGEPVPQLCIRELHPGGATAN
jgi:hypothetical protein